MTKIQKKQSYQNEMSQTYIKKLGDVIISFDEKNMECKKKKKLLLRKLFLDGW